MSNADIQHSLSTTTARKLTNTTKTTPQMGGISPRWLLKLLPWVQVEAGTYRVNRRKVIVVGDGKISIHASDGQFRLEAQDLRELSFLRELNDEVLETLAARFVSVNYQAGEMVAEAGTAGNTLYVVASGKVETWAMGEYGEEVRLNVLGSGDHVDAQNLLIETVWSYHVQALTPCTVLALERNHFLEVIQQLPDATSYLERWRMQISQDQEKEHPIALAAGHSGEIALPETFVDYDDDPREYELSLVQSILRMHTRVSGLYNQPHDQFREQLRLTIEAMKEQQEWEMINHPSFGLLNNVSPSFRVQTRSGPPTPDDMDELLAKVWKQPAFFLAHPQAIAAFGRECTRRGVPPPTIEIMGSPFLTWRGVPLIPSEKVAINGGRERASLTTNILLMRVGEQEQGVIGLHQTGIPDEHLPGLAVQFMGIDTKAIASYLVSTYFSVAILVDDALGVLENVEVAHYHGIK